MNARLDRLARDKEILLARSALCRMHLRREGNSLRESLQWKRAAVAAAKSPATRRIAVGLAVACLGLSRVARAVAVAGGIVLVAKLAVAAIGARHVRSAPPGDNSVRQP
jgi:hypothetical protein